MQKKTMAILILILSIAGIAYASPDDPRKVTPSHSSNDYKESGVFGDNPIYSENAIDLLNYVDWKVAKEISLIDQYKDTFTAKPVVRISVSEIAYGVSEVSCEEGFQIIGDTLKSSDLSFLTASYWGGSGTPEKLWEAIERLAKSVSNSGASPIGD